MPYNWPAETDFALWELDVLDRDCPACGRRMYICDHRYRRFHTLEGPVQLICKLNHCPDPRCPGHAKTKSPELEITIAPPYWAIGWDVFCWIGHRRCSRHMAIPYIQSELLDGYGIRWFILLESWSYADNRRSDMQHDRNALRITSLGRSRT